MLLVESSKDLDQTLPLLLLFVVEFERKDPSTPAKLFNLVKLPSRKESVLPSLERETTITTKPITNQPLR